MEDRHLVKTSKFLSLVLRHKPETIGLSLDANGWADTHELLEKLNGHGQPLTLDQLQHVVATNDKQRFAFSADLTKIRASQGHSLEVDLAYEEREPPDVLYHGTAEKNIAAIRKEGLKKGKRHHVHLSLDVTTAKAVGSRYGKPVVLTIHAKQMMVDCFPFYQATNGVWLTEWVPPQYIKFTI